MAAFSKLTKAVRAPGRTLLLEPWVFADEWDKRPSDAVCVGLRIMSEADKGKAQAEAERAAYEFHPDGGPAWVPAFESALARQVVALGICDPNDVMKPSSVLPYAEEQVRFALSTRGVEYIFEQHRRYEVEISAIEPMATDEDVEQLIELLQAGGVERFSAALRRSLYNVLERVAEATV
jgi:hypothetical protein